MDGKPRILAIDDDENILRVIGRALEKSGFEVATASDGLSGLRKAVETSPNLIVLDVMMPGMDGYEVCRRLRDAPATAGIPVILLTGKGRLDTPDAERSAEIANKRVQEQLAGFEAGAVEFLTKPVKPEELLQRVRAWLWVDSLGDARQM